MNAPRLLGAHETLKTLWAFVSAPLSAWLVSALALWIWHIPLLFDQTLAQRLDSRGATYDFPGDSTDLLVAIGESHTPPSVMAEAWFTSSPQFCIPAYWERLLTFAPRPWYSSYVMTAPAWRLSRSEDQQTWWIDHVDSSRDAAADCCSRLARQVDERVAD